MDKPVIEILIRSLFDLFALRLRASPPVLFSDFMIFLKFISCGRINLVVRLGNPSKSVAGIILVRYSRSPKIHPRQDHCLVLETHGSCQLAKSCVRSSCSQGQSAL